MPLYRYQCFSCGLQFKIRISRSKLKSLRVCKSCGAEAKRCLPSGLNHGFDAETQDLAQPNTGVSSIDYDFDRVVALDSKKKWELVNRRQQFKHDLIRGISKSPRNIARVGDNYEVVDDQELSEMVKKRQKLG